MARHGSLAEQLFALSNETTSPKSKARVAANDNKPRVRSDLPALRWLQENRPDLAPAVADAIPRPPSNWFIEVEPTRQEIRPTVGELMKASQDDDGNVHKQEVTNKGVRLGKLIFRKGILVEWGETKKGNTLKPTDRPRTTQDKSATERRPGFYLRTKPTTKSTMDADHYHRPLSTQPAIPPMYDPLTGVTEARKFLEALGIDGTVPAEAIAHAVKVGRQVVAVGAGFLGGVSSPSGNSSEGAVTWEAPEDRKSNAKDVLDEVAARGTLKSIGMMLGYSEAYAHIAGKHALVELAETLDAMKKSKNN